MKRARYTWLLFALCAGAVLAAMGWASATVVRLERAHAEAIRQSAVEERVRLALWRMDSVLTPLIALENARPYFDYTAFYPLDRAYTRMYNEIQPEEVLVPSPLLPAAPPNVLLHFQFGPDGELTSPQAPGGNMRDIAESRGYASHDRVDAAVARLRELNGLLSRDALLAALGKETNPAPAAAPPPPPPAIELAKAGGKKKGFDEQQKALNTQEYYARNVSRQQAVNKDNTAFYNGLQNLPQGGNAPQAQAEQGSQQDDSSRRSQGPSQSAADWRFAGGSGGASTAPASSTGSGQAQPTGSGLAPLASPDTGGPAPGAAARGSASSQPAGPSPAEPATPSASSGQAQAAQAQSQPQAPQQQPPPPVVVQGELKALWNGSALVLARTVSAGGRRYVQGCWLDWPGVRKWLLASAEDLLPKAELVAASGDGAGHGARMLANLPVRLVPGAVADTDGLPPSPLWLSLAIAWVCVVLAAAVAARVLQRAISLSERRGAFVSAVTHEMRTPLTTFRMYTEMLAEGMVADEQRRRKYLDVLLTEADRLSHLVENVLGYARLEGPRSAARAETITLGELLEKVSPRLSRRAALAGMQLVVEPPTVVAAEDAANHGTRTAPAVRADLSAVEQILMNLVDNACKYAVGATDKRIHLSAGTNGGGPFIATRDHGPGIPPAKAGQLFLPFRKSAHQAAESAPGIGLGLALSRRLARNMGGDLSLESCEWGACFVLSLPTAGKK